MNLIAEINSYHAHIYFRDAEARERAAFLRERIAERFEVQLGRWHDQPVGPHALPMYQVAFGVAQFARFVPFLMLNRQGLPVLVHSNTKNPWADHIINSLWLGEMLPIMNQERLPRYDLESFMEMVVPNTSPTLTA